MNNCQICSQKAYISFNWKYANEGKDKDLAGFSNHLQHIRSLKFGHLYQCPISQNYWFLDDDGSLMYSVASDKVELLWQWDSKPLVLTEPQIKVLSEIGATESDKYGNGKGEIKIPCMVRRTQDEVYDPTLVVITKMPPIQPWKRGILLGSPAFSMAQSDFALPLNVRIATLNADEVSMGYAPTLVKSRDNQYFVLNWSKHIFAYGQLRGKDISLAERSFSFRRMDDLPVINENTEQVVFVYYDWYDDCQKLVQRKAG